MTLMVESPAFIDGARIPVPHTGDGEDVSVELKWSGVPNGAKERALICDDPDAPTPQPWVHWIIYKITPTVQELPGGIPVNSQVETPIQALQGQNSWPSGSTIGYRGPAPPPGHGVHHYHFKLYALDRELDRHHPLDSHRHRSRMAGRSRRHRRWSTTWARARCGEIRRMRASSSAITVSGAWTASSAGARTSSSRVPRT